MDKLNSPLHIVLLEALRESDGNINDAVQRFKHLMNCDYPWIEARIRQAVVDVYAERSSPVDAELKG